MSCTAEDFLYLYTFCLFPTRFVCIGDFFREIPDNYCIATAALIDAKCLVFPQQRGFDWCEVPSFAQQHGFDWCEVPSFAQQHGFDWCEVPSFAQQRGFDWYKAKVYDSPSNAVLIDAAIFYGTDTELSFIHALPLTC